MMLARSLMDRVTLHNFNYESKRLPTAAAAAAAVIGADAGCQSVWVTCTRNTPRADAAGYILD